MRQEQSPVPPAGASCLADALFHEILLARQRVYALAPATPLEKLPLDPGEEVWIKREDLSPIHAYKWRGAYNRLASLSGEQRQRPLFAASAGNHAQGMALALRHLGLRGKIFMPLSTPKMKQEAVRRHGGNAVEVVLQGDSFDLARSAAEEALLASGGLMIHPFDDLQVMAGQATLADEIVMSGHPPFDRVYLQIGGGGMAAGVSRWLRHFYPSIEIVGVEGVDQASMQAAIHAGTPVDLPYVDVFCDGTAVRRAGDLTFSICREFIDRYITVTNEEVCAATRILWETRRIIPEPAGAMGLAGWLKERSSAGGQRVLTILCGANMDFEQLAWISRHAGLGLHTRRFLRFQLSEKSGSLLQLLEEELSGFNIVEFQYGRTGRDFGHPVIGLEAPELTLDALEQRLIRFRVKYEDVTGSEDVEFRIIPCRPDLMHHPLFFQVEFAERVGALHDFLVGLGSSVEIVYFNYSYTGERVGRALLGLDFGSLGDRVAMQTRLTATPAGLRSLRFLPPSTVARVLS